MNANTDKTQHSSSLTDKAEAIYTTLEQTTSILDMLALKHIKTPDYPVFMVLEDELLGKAKQKLNDLIGDLPNDKPNIQPLVLDLPVYARNFAVEVRGKALELIAICKAISEGCLNEGIRDASHLDRGDSISLADVGLRLAREIAEKADHYQLGAKCEVQA